MAETLRQPVAPSGNDMPALHWLGPAAEPLVVVRHPDAARKLAESHRYLITRMADRLAACWPDGVDVERLRAEGAAALSHIAATVESPEDIAAQAIGAVAERMRQVLAASEWYRQAMLGRARPLTDTWRGLVLAGRTPTDETLCRRLHLDPRALADRFVEFAVVFVVEPGALLPAGVDAKYAVAEIVSALPGAQQLTVALYYHQELTFPEIARVMGLEARQTQELFGRAATSIAGEAGLPLWRGGALTA